MALDVYRDWLGITESARPLDHYQLFGLKKFEDDPATIRAQYRKFNAEVRKYAAGQYGEQSQVLLNELAKAMLVLTDAVRKAEYDATLGRGAGATTERRTFEQILVARKVVDSQALDKARRLSKTINVEVKDACLQLQLAPPDQIVQAFAESQGLPYLDLGDIHLDEKLVPQVPAVLARQNSCAPLMIDNGQLLIISAGILPPEIEDQLRLRLNAKTVRLVLCTPTAMNDIIGKHYPKEALKAQMAAASAAPKAAAAAAKALAGAAAAPAAPTPGQPMSYDTLQMLKKQRLVWTGAAFGLTFGALSLVISVMIPLAKRPGMFTTWMYQSIAAAIVAGIVYLLKAPK